MLTTCKACNNQSNGMISIFHHPNGVDKMYTFVSGIEEVSRARSICEWKVYTALTLCLFRLKSRYVRTTPSVFRATMTWKLHIISNKNAFNRICCRRAMPVQRKIVVWIGSGLGRCAHWHTEKKNGSIFIPDDTCETDEKPNISGIEQPVVFVQPIEVEDDEIAPSSTSLERSILLDQNSVVECETVEDDDDEEDNLYDLLNIQKRTAKTSDRTKIDSSETMTVGEPLDAIQPRVDLTEVPSQSNSHACKECGKNFNRTGNLKRHQEAVHGTVIQSAKNPKGNCSTEQ